MQYSTEQIEAKLFSEKLIIDSEISLKRNLIASQNKKLVLTNGCFDLLHSGHVFFLKEAAKCADVLWVGINSDASVKQLKGANRPIYSEKERTYILNALSFIDGIFVFNGTNLAKEIKLIKPDVYVKAGDYSINTLNNLEKQELINCNTIIKFLSFLNGYSTTSTLNKSKNM